MTDTKRTETTQTLPVLVGTARPRPSLSLYAVQAPFVSHVIASHQQVPSQRARRRASNTTAQTAYCQSKARNVKRMPAGYGFSASA